MKNVIIMGPTSSGKSQLAVDLAQQIGGVIVNADSQQVYRGLEILTAQPSLKAQSQVPHYLYGYVDVSEPYSVGRWLNDVSKWARAITSPIIFVGGTGLYIKALSEGISPIPPIPHAVRHAIRALGQTLSSSELHARLAARDPEMATRLAPNDTQRILRALEVLEHTGRSLSYWQALPPEPSGFGGATTIALLPDQGDARHDLYRRIEQDTEERLNNGAIKEIECLLEHTSSDELEHKAIGVQAIIFYLRGQILKENFIDLVQTQNRQYAKRQMTWIRHQMTPHVVREVIYTSDHLPAIRAALGLL